MPRREKPSFVIGLPLESSSVRHRMALRSGSTLRRSGCDGTCRRPAWVAIKVVSLERFPVTVALFYANPIC